ncbi:MAG: PAS domain-containing protein [Proteobacteria bacterium]|nr:PAS domain-containing protein [Pseudomonadota bacterium]
MDQGSGTRLERLLRAAERDLGVAVAVPEGLQCPIVWINERLLKRTGYERNEVMGRDWRFLEGKETAPEASGLVAEVMREGKALSVDLLCYRKDGTTFWNRIRVRSIYDREWVLRYFLSSHQALDESRVRRNPVISDEREPLHEKWGRLVWR